MDPREKATFTALQDTSRFGTYQKRVATRAIQMTAPFTVETTEGTMDGAAGDYLCLDTKGNAYLCARDVFEASYVDVKQPTLPAIAPAKLLDAGTIVHVQGIPLRLEAQTLVETNAANWDLLQSSALATGAKG